MVESRMGAVAWAMRQHVVSHPRSSNRTCRSPASGSPTGFTVRHTTGQLGQAFETQQTEFSIDDFTRESVSTASCHLVSSGEEVAHAFIDVSVNTAECGSACPEAEVVRPTEQRPVSAYRALRPTDRGCR